MSELLQFKERHRVVTHPGYEAPPRHQTGPATISRLDNAVIQAVDLASIAPGTDLLEGIAVLTPNQFGRSLACALWLQGPIPFPQWTGAK